MIELNDIGFSYDNSFALTGITTTIPSAQTVGLLGKNGAGKTTLLKIIAGLLFPKKGIITVNNHIPKKREPDFLADMFFIPENFSLPEISQKLYLQLFAKLYPKFSVEQFNALQLSLEIETKKSLKHLSYGNQKKFLLAFGIASQAKLLIFDEPTNGLDISAQASIRQALSNCSHADRLTILSTHHVREFDNLFDSLIIIEHGQLLLNQKLSNLDNTDSNKSVEEIYLSYTSK